jgi:hypothetical protein
MTPRSKVEVRRLRAMIEARETAARVQKEVLFDRVGSNLDHCCDGDMAPGWA